MEFLKDLLKKGFSFEKFSYKQTKNGAWESVFKEFNEKIYEN